MLDEVDKQLISALSNDLPLTSEPYAQVASELGISTSDIIARLEKYRQLGILRKLGAVLAHRKLGYMANALVVSVVSPWRQDDVGKLLSQIPTVSHCYARPPQPDWPYNFYTMLHASTREQCQLAAAEMMRNAGVSQYELLFSIKEWKKSTMIYKFNHDN